MSTYPTDPRVDQYINSLPDWQQSICRRVRELVHAADPDVAETIKRTNRPYFTLEGNICALLAARDHVNVFIYDPIAPEPEGIINQGQGNLTARAIQVRRGDVLNERAGEPLARGDRQQPRGRLAQAARGRQIAVGFSRPHTRSDVPGADSRHAGRRPARRV